MNLANGSSKRTEKKGWLRKLLFPSSMDRHARLEPRASSTATSARAAQPVPNDVGAMANSVSAMASDVRPTPRASNSTGASSLLVVGDHELATKQPRQCQTEAMENDVRPMGNEVKAMAIDERSTPEALASSGTASCIKQAQKRSTGSPEEATADAVPNGTAAKIIVKPRWWGSSRDHAQRLWAYLEANGYVDGCMEWRDLKKLYLRMCVEEGILTRKWNGVAHELTRFSSGGKKRYMYCAAHSHQRVRVYPLPSSRKRTR